MNSSTATSTSTPTDTFVEPWSTVVIAERTVMAHRRLMRTLPFVSPAITGDIGPFLDTVADLFAKAGEGTLITLHVPCLPTYGHDPRPIAEQLRVVQNRARVAGWRSTFAGLEHNSGWVTFVHREPGRAVVHLGVLTAMAKEHVPLFDTGWPPEQIAHALAEFAAATGVAYRAIPGVAGIALIRRWHEHTKAVRKGREREIPRWRWDTDRPEIGHTPGDVVWKRALTREEKRRPYVLAFDINKQYLAAMSQVSLPWDWPRPTGATEFDPTVAGLWRIIAPRNHEMLGRPDGAPSMPTILNPAFIGANRTCWVTTPIMSFLHEHGVVPEVLDSWTSPAVRRTFPDGTEWPGAGRWLRAPAERLRDAIAQHSRPVGHLRQCECPRCRMVTTLKAVGNQAIGLMATDRARIQRKDVHATIRDHARVSELRKIFRAAGAGWVPFRVMHDCVFYAADTPTPPPELIEALGVVTDGRIGRFKFESDRSMTMPDYICEQRAHEKRRGTRRG